MPINYTSAGYQINPQFANLGALQGLQPLDVTRKAQVEYRPLTQMQVYSSQPELATQGIAQGIQAAVGGITGAITAHYAAKAETAKEERKYAHEIALEQSKKGEKTLEKQDQREWELRKMKEQDKLIRERKKGVLPGGFFGSEDNTTESDGDTSATDYSGDLPEIDPITGEDISKEQAKIDFETQVPEMDLSNKSKEKITKQAKALEGLSPKYLTASIEGIGPVAPIPEVPEKPSMSLQGIDVSIIPQMSGKEIAQTRTALRELVSKPKQEISQELGPGLYPVRSQKEANKYLKALLAPNVQPPKLTRLSTGEYAYEVLPMTQEQIAENKMKEEEGKSRISLRKQYEEQKQIATEASKSKAINQSAQAFNKDERIKYLYDAKIGIAPKMESIVKKDIAMKQGKIAAEGVGIAQAGILDEYVRQESGKSITEGQVKFFNEQRTPQQKWDAFKKIFEGKKQILDKSQLETITSSVLENYNNAAISANAGVIYPSRKKYIAGGASEDEASTIYPLAPTDIVLAKNAIDVRKKIIDSITKKQKEFNKAVERKDTPTQRQIEEQIKLLKIRQQKLEQRIEDAEPDDYVIGINEIAENPGGLRGYAMPFFATQETTSPQQIYK